MAEAKSNLVRVTIGDNLTCSFPEGNEVASMDGRARFENFTRLRVEIRFVTLDKGFEVPHDDAVVFDVSRLGSPGKHEFTVHEIKDGEFDPAIKGEGALVIQY